jgi:hypothetical protein
MTYNRARVGIHAAVSGDRNRRKLAAIKRKYARYDKRRAPWWENIWCALYLGFVVMKGVMRRG